MELTLERKGQADTGQLTPNISMTPSLGEDYWAYRVRLTEKQAIVGFPKFTTIGIGFAVEEDWNTNLPYTCDTKEIASHIAHNKGDEEIEYEDVLAAIKLVQEAATEDRKPKATPQDLAGRRLFDGLGSLLTLADEAEARQWTKAQVIEQIRSIVGGVYEGVWHDALIATRSEGA